MTEKEKMLAGEVYAANDKSLTDELMQTREKSVECGAWSVECGAWSVVRVSVNKEQKKHTSEKW